MIKKNIESYFFTELPITEQGANQTFGPVLSNENTIFRTSAMFASSTNIDAFAICSGQVFIQPSEITGKINLILRPYKQPISGLTIKYFIYRGLNEDSFLQTDSSKLIANQNISSASEFIKLVWEQLKKFNDWSDSDANSHVFLSKWIGYDPTNQNATDFIDDYFFLSNDETAASETKSFELPIVSKGIQLGKFSGDYGLDIVLSNGDYKPLSSDTGFNFNLEFARAEQGLLNIVNIPTETSEKQYREVIFNFISPASYYGLHYDNGKVLVRNGDNVIEKEGQLIYDEILMNFLTRNNTYIYIQSDLGRSYNYYGNYSSTSETEDVLKIGIEIDNLQVALPTTLEWPLIIQNQQQNHSNNKNTIHLQLTVGNKTPLLYGQIATFDEKAENNFLVAEQLIPIQQEGETTNTFSQPITLFIPNTGTTGAKQNVSSLIKIIYIAANLVATENVNGEIFNHPIKMIDTLFNPIHITSRFSNPNQEVISWCVSHKNNLVNSSLINKDDISKAVNQTKIIFDKLAYTENGVENTQNRVVFETQLIEGIGKDILDSSNSKISTSNSGSFPFSRENNKHFRLEEPYDYRINLLFDNNNTVTGLELYNTLEDSGVNKYLLGILKEENDSLINLIETENIKNTSIFLSSLSNSEIENSHFHKYQLKVIGEKNTNGIQLFDLNQEIFIYSIDNYFFFSKSFSNYMTKEETDLHIDFTL